MTTIAIVDLMFSWPPHGGGCTDLKETASELKRLGYDVHLFAACCPWAWQRGAIDENALDFPVHKVDFTYRTFNRFILPKRFREEVDKHRYFSGHILARTDQAGRHAVRLQGHQN